MRNIREGPCANLAKVTHTQKKIGFHHFQHCILSLVNKFLNSIWVMLCVVLKTYIQYLVKIENCVSFSFQNFILKITRFFFFSDIDECLLAGGNDCNASVETCENTEGGYICQCLPGYKKTDNHCKGKASDAWKKCRCWRNYIVKIMGKWFLSFLCFF